MRHIPLGLRLPDRAVFTNFLPARNAQALEHARRVASGGQPGLTWLCGPAGVGKSHLLQAVCATASERMRAGYVPLAELAPLGVGVLEGLDLQCLCLDDVDAVAGNAAWERAMFGLLQEAEEGGRGLVLAARAPPALVRRRPCSGCCGAFHATCVRSTSFWIRLMKRHSPRSGALPSRSSVKCWARRGALQGAMARRAPAARRA